MEILTLPFPPSVNGYWRHPTKGPLAGRHLISAEGREYRQAVQAFVGHHQIGRVEGRLSVAIEVFPPDRRKRDLDNLPKGILDSLTHAGVIEDDGHIDSLLIERKGIHKGGMVRVFVTAIQGEDNGTPENS
ncbi:RusA family crossover junction endodeoxyribonuclease [Bordetella hinzii]|uniref:RusA family crossover junction endodeoxyribonuclease n=1 Tax=Bordetella hinzii TaxID=103855 RepID=UPI0011522CB2|nr:RusA family crossover junction endodeoxyribonuclease [Bordetella hinzii]QDJ44988.1 hypothetical protein CBR71_03765 [Bordetella hinzii]